MNLMGYSTSRPWPKQYGNAWFMWEVDPTGDFLVEKLADDYEKKMAIRRDIAYRFGRVTSRLWFMDDQPSDAELLAVRFWEDMRFG